MSLISMFQSLYGVWAHLIYTMTTKSSFLLDCRHTSIISLKTRHTSLRLTQLISSYNLIFIIPLPTVFNIKSIYLTVRIKRGLHSHQTLVYIWKLSPSCHGPRTMRLWDSCWYHMNCVYYYLGSHIPLFQG